MSTSGSEMKHVAHFVVAGLCLYGIKGYLFYFLRGQGFEFNKFSFLSL